MNVPFIFGLAGLVAALVGAGLVMAGMRIQIRDSIDHFISDLHRQGMWLSGGAGLTVVASVLTLVAHILPILSK